MARTSPPDDSSSVGALPRLRTASAVRVDGEVVEQHQLRAQGQHLVELVEGVDLHLARQVGRRGPGPFQRCADRPGRCDVVVLDQHGVAEAEAVVHPAPAAHGVLLQQPQARQRLAGVADPGAGAGDGVDPGRGGRGDAGEVAEQVERGPFGGEQPADGRADDERGLAGGEPGTVRTGVEDLVRPPTTSSSTARTAGTPARTPAARDVNAPTATAPAGTVAAVVASGP